jgi:hypothetical protein
MNEYMMFSKLFGNSLVKEGTDIRERAGIIKKAHDE